MRAGTDDRQVTVGMDRELDAIGMGNGGAQHSYEHVVAYFQDWAKWEEPFQHAQKHASSKKINLLLLQSLRWQSFGWRQEGYTVSEHSTVFIWISSDEAEASACLAELTTAWPDIAPQADMLRASTGTAIGTLEGLVAAGLFRRIEEVDGHDWDFESEARLAGTFAA